MDFITNLFSTNNSNIQYTEINNSTPKTSTSAISTHPFVEMISSNMSEEQMISTMEAFMGTTSVSQSDTPSFYVVDQMEFFAPVLHVFANATYNGKRNVVKWILNNFVPLDVSYDNNFFYKETLKQNNFDITEMLTDHPSFVSDMFVLEDLLKRQKFDLFKKFVLNTNGLIQTRAPSLYTYIDEGKINEAIDLFNQIKQEQIAKSHSTIDGI